VPEDPVVEGVVVEDPVADGVVEVVEDAIEVVEDVTGPPGPSNGHHDPLHVSQFCWFSWQYPDEAVWSKVHQLCLNSSGHPQSEIKQDPGPSVTTARVVVVVVTGDALVPEDVVSGNPVVGWTGSSTTPLASN